MIRPRALIIGNRDDEHVQAVTARLESDSTAIIDADRLEQSSFALRNDELSVYVEGREFVLGESLRRGWIRRYAPQDWQIGTRVGSVEAAASAAWLALLVGFTRLPRQQWLSPPSDLAVAENKLVQLSTASALGLAVPETVVTNRPALVKQLFPDEYVIKPLGPAHFEEDGTKRVIFAIAGSDAMTTAIEGAPPMLLQERLEVREHYRVVVVGNEVWAGALSGESLPLDWRTAEIAHSSFVAVAPSAAIHAGAISICRALGLGYASQDWVRTDDGEFLLDVNPSGQWLFLPDSISGPVTAAIARWLKGTE